MYSQIQQHIAKIKQMQPLVLNITNEVTMDFIANGLLSIGASPIMSKAQEEIKDLISIAQVIVINLGTLNEKFIALCKSVCEIANQCSKPIVLDPVGVGASELRTNTAKMLLQNYQFAIIRGNASEIMALSDATVMTKGVDAAHSTQEASQSAKTLAKQFATTVMISGATDMITDGDRVATFTRGSAFMPMITGSGCLLTAVVAAFHAIESERFAAACSAALFYSVCGEIAAQEVQGPGSFKIKFLDVLNQMPKSEDYA